MSLMDAMLLEGYRDPKEVYIALRADGLKGSGTIDDPYDGGTRDDGSKVITALTYLDAEATADVAGHGYVVGEVVVISGVTGSGAAQWNGTFVVINVPGAGSFKFTLAAVPTGAAVLSGTSVSTRRIHRFDEVMRSLSDGSAVHLGEGVFETRGCDALTPAVSWSVRPGQRILGSGIGATTLRLVHTVPWPGAQLVQAIGHNPFFVSPYVKNADDVEIADLTVDCNMRSQLSQSIAKAAVVLQGSHCRIRRVRAIDYATQIWPTECFVLTAGGADPRTEFGFTERVNSHISDCVLEEPGLDGTYTISGLLLNAGERTDSGEMGWHRACGFHNNYIDFSYRNKAAPIVGISITAGVATVTTRAPHARNTGDWAVISGALVNGSELNTCNGSYQVTRVDDFTFTYQPVAYAGLPVPTTNPTGDMWVGRWSSRLLKLATLAAKTVPSPGSPTRRMRLTTARPHNRTPLNCLNLDGVSVALPLKNSDFNRRFAVLAVPSPVELEFDLDVDMTAPPVFSSNGLIGQNFAALTADGGIAAEVVGNRVFHAGIAGPYHDTWATREMEVHHNLFHDVVVGPMQSIGPGVSTTGTPIVLKSLTHSGTTAIAETFLPHGLLKDSDFVNLSLASVALYNKSGAPVTAVPTPTKFEYALASNPGGPATGAGYLPVELQKLLQSLTRTADGSGFIVTAKTTYARHGLIKGDAVQIIKTGHFNPALFPNATLYNGSFTVIDVPDEKTFRYRLPTDPGVDSSTDPVNFAAGYFGRIWQCARLGYEGNVIDLSSRFGDEANPVGVYQFQFVSGSPGRTNPYTFREIVARDNMVEAVDASYGNVHSSLSSAIRFNSTERALVENNLVRLDYTTPISFQATGTVRASSNLKTTGEPIPSLNLDTGELVDQTRTAVEDAITMSLL